MSDQGALQFARYAYPPNELGYCGPAGARAMLVPGAVADIERRARQFEGAWVYLEFLAEVLGSDDPLSTEVVEAYWIGTDLLDSAEPAALLERLVARFDGQVGGTWRESAGRARAHHSYQVFEVYPWAAMLLAGLPPGPAVSVLDRCRIRSGVVQEVDEERVTVRSRVLGWDSGRLAPRPPQLERARWSIDGQSLLARPVVGDVVALHWDWVCDVLTDDQADRIHRLEAAQRAAVGLDGPQPGAAGR
ncbi:MAG TPA: DUF6390 family protein [Dermatophilaceae bacterium]